MKKAELIFIPTPGIGHLVSTLEFAKRLTDRDDRLLIKILSIKFPSTFYPFAESYTKSLTSSQPRIQLIDLPLVDPPPSDLLKSRVNYVSVYVENNIPNVKDTVTKIVQSSNSNTSSSRVVGFLGLTLYLPNRHNQIETEFSESDPELLIPGILNPVPPSVLPSAVLEKDGGYTAYIKLSRRLRDTKGIIVNTFKELEQYALDSFSDTPPVYAVGPVLDLKGQPNLSLDGAQRDNIMNWLDDQPPLSVDGEGVGISGGDEVGL
ncbi:udp-glycosyltransferase 71k2 [Fagus crenata]